MNKTIFVGSIAWMTGAGGLFGSRGTMMGALYEDVENFFGDIFAWYGRIVARVPWLFVTIPMIVCGLLGLGLLNMTYETDIEVLYTPMDSQAAKDQDFLQQLIPDHTGDNFYSRQQITLGTFGEVIIKRFKNPNKDTHSRDCMHDILAPEVLPEIWHLHNLILNISVVEESLIYNYDDVCAVRDHDCVVEGLEVLPTQQPLKRIRRTYQNTGQQPKDHVPNKDTSQEPKYHVPNHDISILLSPLILSGYSASSNRTCYEVIRLRYHLKHNTTEQRLFSLMWERQFLEELRRYRSHILDVAYMVSESLDIELRDHVGTDTHYLGYSVLAMIIFATIIGSGVNCVTNHVALAYMGVFASLMAILAAFGLISLLGVKFVNLCGVMPFLVLGIGADDMFQLLTEWRQSNVRDSIEDRIASTLRSTAVSITITSLTDLIAFCIGATSPFVSVRNFCACSGVAIFLCYVNQLTFYSGCIVLHARRVQASRHWITCCQTRSRAEMEEARENIIKITLCSGSPPQRVGEEGGVCRNVARILYTYYPRFLLHWITKSAVFVLFITYISVSLWGAGNIKKGIKLDKVVPAESYLTEYMKRDIEYYPDNGPTVTFVVHGAHRYKHNPVFYHYKGTQQDIASLLSRAEEESVVVNGLQVSWLDHYLSFRQQRNMSSPRTEKAFIEDLHGFFQANPTFENDVQINKAGSQIVVSRFYVGCQKLLHYDAEGNLMLQMRRIANSSPLQVLAYSPEFVFYEHYVSILKNTLLPVGVTMIGLLFVALVFIPHPIAVTCVTLAMLSIVVGMVGFMQFWGLTLSAITVIQIIMSLGICMSFTVHICHSFMTATGKNRNERVTVAIEKVGIPILNGALSSLFCAMMLSFGSSFIFTSFFKTMLLVFFLGILHSLVFLPVMLSFIGPRRTSKPRVFIPVSPSCRSLQDTYRVNSMIPRNLSVESSLLDKPNLSSNENSYQELSSQPPGSDKNRDSSDTNRGLGTIQEMRDTDDIQIKVNGVDVSPDSGRRRKVSFHMGDSPCITSRRESENSTMSNLTEEDVMDNPFSDPYLETDPSTEKTPLNSHGTHTPEGVKQR